MKDLYIILNYLRNHSQDFSFVSLQDRIVVSKNDEYQWEEFLEIIDGNTECIYENAMVIIVVPETLRELIFNWIIKNITIQYYNMFNHPNDKWEDVKHNMPYWDATTKYRIKPT